VRIVKSRDDLDGWFDPHSTNAMLIVDGNAVIEEEPFKKYPTQALVANGVQFIIGTLQVSIDIVKFVGNTIIQIGDLIIKGLTELAMKVVDFAKQTIDAIKHIAHEVKEKIKGFISDVANNISNWFKENFNAGYKYASANPVITVDTYKLRNYAQRLESINRRLRSLDSRLDSLYWHVGLLDVWNLMRADLMTGESRKINRIIHYLEETANLFEKVERNLKSYV
jgi:hypothetical protein